MLFLLLCGCNIAYASDDDFSFIVQPYFVNTTCGGKPYYATFTIQNNEDVPIEITYINLERNDIFPPDLLTIDNGPLTTCKIGHPGVPGKGTCNINLIVEPSKGCSSQFISDDVYRLLHVGINTWQKEVTADPIIFNYQTVAPPNPPPTPAQSFAVLGSSVENLGSTSSITGNIGYSCSNGGSIDDNYSVTNGMLYEDPENDVVQSANQEFGIQYKDFIKDISLCRPRNDLDQGDRVTPSYYCLSSISGMPYVDVDGVITLEGQGDYVFFIESGIDNCFSENSDASSPCELRFGESTKFIYLEGASPKNVYWITGRGHKTFLASGAKVEGTILAGGPIITDDSGPNPANVCGQLWSEQTITLYGDAVADQHIAVCGE